MLRFSIAFIIVNACLITNVSGISGTPKESLRNNPKCTSDAECQFIIAGSKCDGGFCKCLNDTVLSSDGTMCITLTGHYYGSLCVDNLQCSNALTTGGVCSNNQCTCKEGYHYLKGSCWKNAGLKQYCTTSEQCYDSHEYIGFDCVNNTCTCRKNYYERFGFGCRKKMTDVRGSCALHTDCHCSVNTTTPLCKSEICTCKNGTDVTTKDMKGDSFKLRSYPRGKCNLGYYERDGVCQLELGMKCDKNSKSDIPYASCIDDILTCTPNVRIASENNQNCLKASPGQIDNLQQSSCNSTLQCGTYGSKTYCQDGKCKCEKSNHWLKRDNLCRKTKHLTESCESDDDCYISNGTVWCSGKLCKCKGDFWESGIGTENEICIKKPEKVGDQCSATKNHCPKYSECDSEKHTCQCKKGYFLVKDNCKPGVNATCSNISECIENAVCQKLTCQCFNNYISCRNGELCLPVVNYGEKCTEIGQCSAKLGELVTCTSGKCRCVKDKAFYSKEKNLCRKIAHLDEKCEDTVQCQQDQDPKTVICKNYTCTCKDGFRQYREKPYDKCGSSRSMYSTKTICILTTSLIFIFRHIQTVVIQ